MNTRLPEGRMGRNSARHPLQILLGVSIAVSVFAGASSYAQEPPRAVGSTTKLPIPRFVSLKPSDTPMREGPSKDHRIKWVFKREGLPVEVIAEFEQWRRIRDSESTDGWVYHGRLSNRRTVIITAAKDKRERELFARESDSSAVVAKLQPGVIANVESCTQSWCKVSVDAYSGYLKKDAIWGVYADERVK